MFVFIFQLFGCCDISCIYQAAEYVPLSFLFLAGNMLATLQRRSYLNDCKLLLKQLTYGV